MKKTALLLCFTIILITVFSAFPAYAYTPTFDVSAKSVYLVNTDTGDVLYSKNKDERVYPASVSYLMNALVVCEHVSLDDSVTVNGDTVKTLLGTGAIVAGLSNGEVISVKDLLCSMLIASQNDAALVLADHVSGGVDGFLDLMNEKAKSLGMKNTHYSVVTGLYDGEQYTTADDIYKLSRAAFDNPDIHEILSATRYTVPATNKKSSRILSNTNWLIDKTTSYFYKYATVGKTGNSEMTGRTVTSAASYDGANYMCVVCGCDSKAPKRPEFTLTAELYRWAFSSFQYKTVVTKGDQIPVSAKVDLSWDVDSITLTAGDTVIALLPTDADLSTIEYVPELDKKVFDAPIKAGDVLGTAKIYYTNPEMDDSEPIGSIEICAGENVELSPVLLVWRWIHSVISNIFVIILVILLIVAFIALTVAANVKAKREQKKKLKLKKRL